MAPEVRPLARYPRFATMKGIIIAIVWDPVVSWDTSSRTKASMIRFVRYVSKTVRLESFNIGPFPVHGLPAGDHERQGRDHDGQGCDQERQGREHDSSMADDERHGGDHERQGSDHEREG